MASITLTIPDAQVQRVLNGFALAQGYREFIIQPNQNDFTLLIPNPQTKVQFLKAKLLEYVITNVKQAEGSAAALAAKTAAESSVDSGVTLS